MLRIIGFEMSVVRLVKMDHDRHNFALVQLARSLALAHATAELLLLVLWCIDLPKIIDTTLKFG